MKIKEVRQKLINAGIDTADLESRILLEDIAGLSSTDMITKKEDQLSGQISWDIEKIIDRRQQGEPLGRILGYRDFWKSRFYLSPDTLEPRPDTETLIETVLASGKVPRTILDLGTGTGCILLSLLQEFPLANGIGIDLSAGACDAAQKNAGILGLGDRVRFLNGSWLEPLPDGIRFDLIVSNPPYIPSAEIRNLQVEVKNHDPILALDGGDDGLDPYKYLLPKLKKYLEPDGRVLFEFGIGQCDDLIRLVEESGANLSRVVSDLGGVPRVVEITFGDN